MDSFYIFLITAIATGALIGWLVGFAKLFSLIVKLLLAITTAYYCNEAIRTSMPDVAEWASLVVFIVVAVVGFGALHSMLRKRFAVINKAAINKPAGALAGLSMAFAGALSFAQQAAIFSLPQNMQSIANVLNSPVELAAEKINSVFQQQAVQVMASDAAGPIPEEGIKLNYTTNVFELRSELEEQMLQLVNTERKAKGLQQLAADNGLTAAARLHSADMFRRGYFSHNTPEGTTPFDRLRKLKITYRYAGENLAMAPSLAGAHDALMKSPGHRANILNASFGKIGIGIMDAGAKGLMLTQEFRD